MKLKFYKTQTIEVELKRKPTKEEIKILEGKDDELTIFDIDDLIDWNSEEVIDEDYSNNVQPYIGFNELID